MNSLPKTVTRQRQDCDLNLGLSAPESSMLTTRLQSQPVVEPRPKTVRTTRSLLKRCIHVIQLSRVHVLGRWAIGMKHVVLVTEDVVVHVVLLCRLRRQDKCLNERTHCTVVVCQLSDHLTVTREPISNTHTRLTALCPGLSAGTRKVKPIWIFHLAPGR